MMAYPGEPLLYPPHMLEEVARERRETDHRIKMHMMLARSFRADNSDAEHRANAANRRAEAAEHRADAAERRAAEAKAEAEQREVEAERHAKASTPSNERLPPKPAQQITAPAPTPAQRLTSKEAPAMSPEKLARLQDVESASARLAAARQGLEDAKYLARAGIASDPVFAAHSVAGALNEWNRASAAFLSYRD